MYNGQSIAESQCLLRQLFTRIGQVICVGACAGDEFRQEIIRRDVLAFRESFRRVRDPIAPRERSMLLNRRV